MVDGVRVPSFACTVAEIMRDYGFVNAIIAASCALRRQVTKQQIAHELRQLGDCEPYVWRALEYASPLCANGGEARALAVMIEEGLSDPFSSMSSSIPTLGGARTATICGFCPTAASLWASSTVARNT